MALFDFFEKEYTDWTLEVDDKEQENVTINAIKNHLTAICNNYNDFMILTPSNPIPIPQMACVCNFVQLCKDKEAGFFFTLTLLITILNYKKKAKVITK